MFENIINRTPDQIALLLVSALVDYEQEPSKMDKELNYLIKTRLYQQLLANPDINWYFNKYQLTFFLHQHAEYFWQANKPLHWGRCL